MFAPWLLAPKVHPVWKPSEPSEARDRDIAERVIHRRRERGVIRNPAKRAPTVENSLLGLPWYSVKLGFRRFRVQGY